MCAFSGSAHATCKPTLWCLALLLLQPVVAVRFCPVIFRRDDQPQAQQAQQQAGSAEPQATPAPAAGAGAAVGDAAVEVEPGEAAAVPAAPAAAPSEPALPFDLPYKMVFAVSPAVQKGRAVVASMKSAGDDCLSSWPFPL